MASITLSFVLTYINAASYTPAKNKNPPMNVTYKKVKADLS